MLKSIVFICSFLICNAVWSQTTLQSVTTTGNVTTNTLRITGQGNIGSSGSGEIVLGILNTPISSDTRTFVGWKGDAATNTITNGPAGGSIMF